MGRPVNFEAVNTRFGPPKGVSEEEVCTLPAYVDARHIISCWQLDEEELKEVTETGVVYLTIVGQGMPPVFVGSSDRTLELVNR